MWKELVLSVEIRNVNYVSNCYKPICAYNSTLRLKPQLSADCFEKSLTPVKNVSVNNVVSFGRLPQILQGNSRKISAVALKELKKNSWVYSKLLEQASASVDKVDAQNITKYCDLIKRGLKNLSGDLNFKFVSIGQSPAALSEVLRVQGMDTAICPISKLGTLSQKSVMPAYKKSGNYFEYLQNFGLGDLSSAPKKTHYFVDYAGTGTSLKKFEELLKCRMGISPKNQLPQTCKVVSLQSIVNAANLTADEKVFAQKFESEYLEKCRLKQRYSPIFKLHIDELSAIEQKHKQTLAQTVVQRIDDKTKTVAEEYEAPHIKLNKLLFYLLDKNI